MRRILALGEWVCVNFESEVWRCQKYISLVRVRVFTMSDDGNWRSED